MKEFIYSVLSALGFFFLKVQSTAQNLKNLICNAAENFSCMLKYFFKVASPYIKAFRSKWLWIWGGVAVALMAAAVIFISRTSHYYAITYRGDVIGYTHNQTAVYGTVAALKKDFTGIEKIEKDLDNFGSHEIQTYNIFLKCLDTDGIRETVITAADTICNAQCVYIDNELVLCALSEKNVNNALGDYKKDRITLSKAIKKNYTSCEVEWLADLKITTECTPCDELTTEKVYKTLYGIFEEKLPYRITCVQIETVSIPYVTSYTRSENLLSGSKFVTQQGVNGTKDVEKRIVVENGEVIETKVLSEKVTKNAVTRKVQIGNGLTEKLDSHLALLLPTEGRLTSGYGMRSDPFTHKPAMHLGIDIGAKTGTEIIAAAAGKVIKASDTHNGYGKCVIIEHYKGFQTLYGHCSELLVEVGEYVNAGDLIAKVGSTGRSTAPHLHFSTIVDGVYTDPSVYY